MSTQNTSTHGADTKGTLFKGAFPLRYALEGPLGGYQRQSAKTALLLDCAIGGISGKHIADLGCGYGTTAIELARFSPAALFSCDSSPEMIDLARLILLSEEPVRDWLEQRHAGYVYEERYDDMIAFFERKRRVFKNMPFSVYRRDFTLMVADVMTLSLSAAFDGVALNNVFHWPVNQVRAKLGDQEHAIRSAVITALRSLRDVVKSGGAVVLMEPKEFVVEDRDPALARYYETHTLDTNAVYRKVHELLKELLRTRHGIAHEMPRCAGLFPIGEFGDWARAAGFTLERVVHVADSHDGDPLEWCTVRLPIWMGKVDLPFDEKLAITKEVESRLGRQLTPEERFEPMHLQSFYFVLRKVA